MGNGFLGCACVGQKQKINSDIRIDEEINGPRESNPIISDKPNLFSDSDRNSLIDLKYSNEYNALINSNTKTILIEKNYNIETALDVIHSCLGKVSSDLNCIVLIICKLHYEIVKLEQKEKFVESGLTYYLNVLKRVNYSYIKESKKFKVRKLIMEILGMIICAYHRCKDLKEGMMFSKDPKIVFLVHLIQINLVQVLKPSVVNKNADVVDMENNLRITKGFLSEIAGNVIN